LDKCNITVTYNAITVTVTYNAITASAILIVTLRGVIIRPLIRPSIILSAISQ
jgi:hypothetical protein